MRQQKQPKSISAKAPKVCPDCDRVLSSKYEAKHHTCKGAKAHG